MIEVSKLNGKPFVLNAWHIEHLEATPDTVITLTNGKRYIVKESVQEVQRKATMFYRETARVGAIPLTKGAEDEDER
jgi:flagellar protein FlbD